MKNLGPVSEEWLASVGIHSLEDLRRIGAEAAYERVQEAGHDASKNLLYALIGAVEDVPWQEVARRFRGQKKKAPIGS